ncbi:GPI transamidase component GPI16, putative [Plasmodium berghei]|uniref:GPI transamidase component GPI16 n=2 Tax=Plasmodium berghei TaxID=5821 RepID=A0A509AJW0_PLABA|nr:GPI transamidase component GPI16 [Plasmodium berghei ANKA]CXI43651.1 GPI transamidase component GPI16, putative [Plasmodium berghei]SCM22363.1 GPI transamidase component GPI16, putative [Plasmodium berghei]SCN25399.1 GPI transamidase component GPI16, putative [Plasmodium berghei]SCO60379.1 GPI transamidase component GPI16, putative [Plasmodium berghei]SCO62134.1 GPI transamidase component GPI16, putative [Plasmodium berghei]|eukprot:XP_034421612.1 GPI transamidase component GPI16 [Plasmodium berghei ANKA]
MKGVKYFFLIIICVIYLAKSYTIDESANVLPLDNNLVHVKLKLNVNGKAYKDNFLPINVLKVLNYVKSLKINIKRGVYRNYYNNRYLDKYPYGFTFEVELKKADNDNNNKKTENSEFSKPEIFILHQLLNEIWSITGVSTNLLKIKDMIKVHNKIFAFLPDESICTEYFSFIKKLYPCKDFGGLFNAINSTYLISKLSTNIGFELNDNDENFLLLYIDYITHHDQKKDVRIIDLIDSKYSLNDCPLIDRNTLVVQKQDDGFISTIFKTHGAINLFYENINLYNILQNPQQNILEEYINVDIIREEANSMITADIKKKQSSLLYIFQNLNTNKNSDFLFVDKLPYHLTPLLHTIMIQGNAPNDYDRSKGKCNFIYFGETALKKFNIKFSNFDNIENIPKSGSFYYIHFEHNLPSLCKITIRFEVVKIRIRSFEFEFDIDRGILLGSGVFVQKRNHSLHENNDFMYKYTPSILIDIVLPDTSMPFNVMAIATCVIMLFFGFIFKLTAKEETRYI